MKKQKVLMAQALVSRGLGRAVWVLTVAVTLPLCLESVSAVADEVVLKDGNGLGMASAIGGKEKVSKFAGVAVVLERAEVGGEGGPEDSGGAGKTVAPSSATKPPGDQNGSGQGDEDGDYWYWYVQFPVSTLTLLWAAGLFGAGGRSGGRHEKPNVQGEG